MCGAVFSQTAFAELPGRCGRWLPMRVPRIRRSVRFALYRAPRLDWRRWCPRVLPNACGGQRNTHAPAADQTLCQRTARRPTKGRIESKQDSFAWTPRPVVADHARTGTSPLPTLLRLSTAESLCWGEAKPLHARTPGFRQTLGSVRAPASSPAVGTKRALGALLLCHFPVTADAGFASKASAKSSTLPARRPALADRHAEAPASASTQKRCRHPSAARGQQGSPGQALAPCRQ